jgi:hypothetical protein
MTQDQTKSVYAVSSVEPYYRVVLRETNETIRKFSTLPAAFKFASKMEAICKHP